MKWYVTNGCLPSAYEYNGRVYAMNTDFRDWMKFELLMTDPDICPYDKTRRLEEMIFPDVPDDPDLWNFIMWFYHSGECSQESGERKGAAKNPSPVYSFEHDFSFIFAGFMEVYGIDIVSIPYLHWWKFKALFASLHNCRFSDIVQFRSEKITSNTPDYRKQFLKNMKKIYALPRSLSEQQKIDELKKIRESMGY